MAATDYPGLGTPEVHPYLVGVSEGRAVLDSVRAARHLPGAGASKVRYAQLPGIGHLFVARDVAPDAVNWITARFRGAPPPNDCTP